jgi:hypothetical protein
VNVLVATGSLCLLITLGLAWCLVGVRSSAVMKRVFPNYQYLLKAHIDYLMMTGLLMIFFLLFNHFAVMPSRLVALSIRPTLNQKPNSPFGAVMASSFTLTTIGYAGAAWSIGQAALRAM